MSFEARIHLKEYNSTSEIFPTRGDAINFAKRIHRDGYTKEDGGRITFYPIGTILSVVVEESDERVPERPLGHGL